MSLVGASPDGLLVQGQDHKPWAVIEAKCKTPFVLQGMVVYKQQIILKLR